MINFEFFVGIERSERSSCECARTFRENSSRIRRIKEWKAKVGARFSRISNGTRRRGEENQVFFFFLIWGCVFKVEKLKEQIHRLSHDAARAAALDFKPRDEQEEDDEKEKKSDNVDDGNWIDWINVIFNDV